MDNKRIMEAINETVSNVLEQTAFMFPESIDMASGVAFEDFEYILVKLNFSGDKAGEVKMIMPVDFCAELSANLLGEDIGDVDPEENNFDSAKELLNIVSGQLLVNLFGDEVLFNLTDLEMKKLEEEAFFSIIEGCEYHCCMVDEYPVITIFDLQEITDECQSISS
ncbi:MAG: hypothetical protein DRP51_04825 [Candidatus Zixiibacteriota bacterium]|nr:MAG: hypothetical protein DRP51_04825 [candidate division Zixibacteria bacterium]